MIQGLIQVRRHAKSLLFAGILLVSAVCAAQGTAAQRAGVSGRASQLVAEHFTATAGGGDWGDARRSLEACANSQQQAARQQTCESAQRQVDACNSNRDAWGARKARVIDEGSKVGVPMPAMPRLTLPPCPYTLPQSHMTPAQALAGWLEEDRTNADFLTRCDSLQSEVFGAIDANELDKATGLTNQLQSVCGSRRQGYAGAAEGAKRRIAEARAATETTALTRRQGDTGTDALNRAVASAEREERERPERERRQAIAAAQQTREAQVQRLQLEAAGAEQARQAEARRESDRQETFRLLGQLGGMLTQIQRDKADQQQAAAARLAAQRAAALATQQQEIELQNQRAATAAQQTMREIATLQAASQNLVTTERQSSSPSQQSNRERSLADKRMSDELERKNNEYEKQRLTESNNKKLRESQALQRARELEVAARVNDQQIKRQREEQEQKEAALERQRREIAFERATSASISAEIHQPNAVTVTVMNQRCPSISIRNNMSRASAIVTFDANISGVRSGGGPHNITHSMTFHIGAGVKREQAIGGGFDCDKPWYINPSMTWIEGKQN